MANPSSDGRLNAAEPALHEDLRGGAATSAGQGYEPDDGPLSPAQVATVPAKADSELPKGAIVRRSSLFL